MSWQILITLQTIIVSVSVLFTRAIARQKVAAKAGFVVMAAWAVITYLMVLCLLPFIYSSVDLSSVRPYIWLLFANGLLFGLGNVAIYKLLSHLDAGFSSILATLVTISTITFANLFLHEKLTIQQIIGALVLVMAIIYTTLVAREHHKKKATQMAWLWGFAFAAMASIPYGLGQVSEKYLLNHINIPTYIVTAWAMQMVVPVVIALIVQPQKFKILRDKNILKLSLLGAFCRTAAGLIFLLALVKSNSISIVSIITNFRLITIILLGALVFKERQKLGQKLIAAGIAIAGLSIIFWK